MRYLLEKDNEDFKRLTKLKEQYFDYRQPNKLIGGMDAQIQFHIKDLEYDVQAYNMMSEKQIDIDKYIEQRISKQRDDLVLNTFDVQFSENTEYYQIRALYNYASPTYLKVLNSIEYFNGLKLKAQSWLLPLAKMDLRNLVIQDDYVKLGKRERNEEDPRLLGKFISFTKLMPVEEYDEKLKMFKSEI